MTFVDGFEAMEVGCCEKVSNEIILESDNLVWRG
jgi:hypothetical protein